MTQDPPIDAPETEDAATQRGALLYAIGRDASGPAADDGPAGDDADEKRPAANDEAVRMRIRQLEEEHRDLDQAIVTMEERMPYDRLTIQRLKKRKLALKDRMSELHESILPDIIA